MKLSGSTVQTIYNTIDREIKSMKRVKFSFHRKWTNNFPKEPGVYAVFYKDDMFYIGESANLKERMKELKRTVNHSFRRKLGRYFEPHTSIKRGKFCVDLENRLDYEYTENISISFVEVNFGRKEIEEYLMKVNVGVLNTLIKRSLR